MLITKKKKIIIIITTVTTKNNTESSLVHTYITVQEILEVRHSQFEILTR
jgi:hypothetical protein